MRNSLYAKFIIGYLILGIAAFLIISSNIGNLLEWQLISKESRRLYAEAYRLADKYEDEASYSGKMGQPARTELQRIASYTGAPVWLVSVDGRITYDTDEKRKSAVIPDFDKALEKNYVTGTAGGLFTEEMISVTAPVSLDFSVIGYVMMHYPLKSVIASRDGILRLVYISSGIVYALSFLVLLIFHFSVFRPLRKITVAAGEYAKGNLDYRIENVENHDEMEYLAAALNFMAEEQSNLEKYQRDFISNVSHDFRSPLTSINGYLEAILDGTIPEELHEKYIRRVIGETERLNKLTEEMLALGRLDSKNILNKKVFDINKAVRGVCAAYENACAKKNLSFELLFELSTEMVYADLEKIQRVLYNLIDNAVKFSYPDTVITVSTVVRTKKVFVSVRDRGEGIPRKSIKKIWDRFYKIDASRGRDKQGTGLGLAIVKEIITSHGETIDVVSTEKVGTEFTFSLPLAETDQKQ